MMPWRWVMLSREAVLGKNSPGAHACPISRRLPEAPLLALQ